MESSLQQFAYAMCVETVEAQRVAFHALNAIAFDASHGVDDLNELEKICTHAFTTVNPGFLKRDAPWIVICTLLSNVNYLDHWAMHTSDFQNEMWRDCLIQGWVRSSMAMRCYIDNILSVSASTSSAGKSPLRFELEVMLLPILLRRLRVSGRRVAHFAVGDNDPIRMINRELTMCFKHLTRIGKESNNQISPGFARAKMYLLTEAWRVNPVEVTLSVQQDTLHQLIQFCPPSLVMQAFFYYGIHALYRGNVRLAEDSFAKAFSLSMEVSASVKDQHSSVSLAKEDTEIDSFGERLGSGHPRAIIASYWIVCNLTRGWIPRTQLLESDAITCFHGILLALQSGRLDVYEESLDHMRAFYTKHGMIFPVLRTRLIVLRNFISRFYANHPSEVHEVSLEALHTAIRQSMGASYAQDLETLRDVHLLPLVMSNWVCGRIYVNLNVLKLNKNMPFPDIPLEDGQPLEPEEPIQV